jgi:signal transduction histidine kinase/cytochrome c biogenesis protein CcdA
MNSTSSRIAMSVLLSAVLPLTVGLAGLYCLPSWHGQWTWHSEPLHSTIESVGGFSALTLGILLVLVSVQKQTVHPNVWLATSLVAKGTLDLFHAGLGPALPFVWFRCFSTFVGGLLFAAAWLPERFSTPKRLHILPVAAACVVTVFAVAALFFPDFPENRFESTEFGPVTRMVNAVGGALYIAASFYFLKRYRKQGKTEDLLWLNVSMLFGVSGILFDPSLHWNYAWWFWHGLRLTAWLLCLGYFFFVYAQAEKAVRVARDRLAREVAQRKQAEEDIRQKNRFLNTVIESLTYPFYVLDADDFTIKIANSAAVTNDGSTRNACYALTRHNDKPCLGPSCPCPLETVVATGQPAIVEQEYRDRTGIVRNVEVHAHPITDTNGKVIQLIEYCLDITDRKRHETEREQFIGELAAKNAELERFTYTVSHDLKSPLITIKGFLGYLAKDMKSGNVERAHTDMARIHAAVDKMSQLLEDLLKISRIGRIVNPPQDVPMEKLLKTALDLLANRIAEKGIIVDAPAKLPVLYGDASRLGEVIENLLDNAVKFAGNQPHPRVEIQVSEDDRTYTVCLRDNGIGIEHQYREKIFELFERLGNEVEGTGVGLAIVKRIIDVHGGEIWVESEGLGRGSAFCFTLPKKHETGPDPERTA